jgi:hypothetical protein
VRLNVAKWPRSKEIVARRLQRLKTSDTFQPKLPWGAIQGKVVMIRVIIDSVLFCCMGALIAGIVAATTFIG